MDRTFIDCLASEFFAAVIGVGQNVLPVHLVVHSIETKVGRFLRFRVQRRLQLRNTCGGSWTHRQSLSPRRFLRFLSTKAPSLHRHCPASSVLRASPSPHTARPGSRELPVDPNFVITAGGSRVAPDPLCLHVATTPAGLMELIRSRPLRQLRPSPHYSWVGSCITFFEACSAFTRVTTYRLAESPSATLYIGSGGFVASTAAPTATGWSNPVPGRVYFPAVDQRLFTAHRNGDVTKPALYTY